MIRDLDDTARQEVFDRDGRVCVRCHNQNNGAQWAHVIGRRHLATRWLVENALTLCGGCHFWWHSMPMISMDWFRKNWPERYETVLAVFNLNRKVNVRQVWLARVGSEHGE